MGGCEDQPIKAREAGFSWDAIASGWDFRLPRCGRHFDCAWAFSQFESFGYRCWEEVTILRRYPLHRGGSEARRRPGGPAPGPGEWPPCPRLVSSPTAPGPAPPTGSDGGGSAEGPASGKRSSSGPSPPSPPSPHQTLKPRVRGACSRAHSPGPGVQDDEAAVGGALFLLTVCWHVAEGHRRRDRHRHVQRFGGLTDQGLGQFSIVSARNKMLLPRVKLAALLHEKLAVHGTFLAFQWLGLRALTAKGGFQSPVRELRSHKPHGVAKKKKKSRLLHRWYKVESQVGSDLTQTKIGFLWLQRIEQFRGVREETRSTDGLIAIA